MWKDSESVMHQRVIYQIVKCSVANINNLSDTDIKGIVVSILFASLAALCKKEKGSGHTKE